MSIGLTNPFNSKYGFSSTGFSVDTEGNIVAKSIILSEFDINGDVDFIVDANIFNNSSIIIYKNQTYFFELRTTFYILDQNLNLYVDNLKHSSGIIGEKAQGLKDGFLSIQIPENYPYTTLYISNNLETQLASITIKEPIGLFSKASIVEIIDSTNSTTGALTVAGGLGIGKDIFLNGSLNFDNSQTSLINTSSDLNFNVDNEIIFNINSVEIGRINSLGTNLPINNTDIDNITLNNSIINNTSIGENIPSTAQFSEATLLTVTNNKDSISNKEYVDNTALTLAVTFGL